MKIAPKRNCIFIVALLVIILTNPLQAQKLLLARSNDASETSTGANYFFSGLPKFSITPTHQLRDISTPTFFTYNRTGYDGERYLSADYYEKNIGVICKMEWSFEKYTHVPLRFRLGSLEYVNHLEGKK
jgi:hypothetical protein